MRKLAIAALAILAVSLSACACPAAKQSAVEVENTNQLIAPKFEAYVKADTKLSDKDKDDWMKLSEKNKKNIKALKDALKD